MHYITSVVGLLSLLTLTNASPLNDVKDVDFDLPWPLVPFTADYKVAPGAEPISLEGDSVAVMGAKIAKIRAEAGLTGFPAPAAAVEARDEATARAEAGVLNKVSSSFCVQH